MTAEAELTPTATVEPEKKKEESAFELHPLEALFSVGYAESPVIEIYKDANVELKAKFRTLLPAELRDITEIISKYTSETAQVISERMETLARAIVTINYMPLVLTKPEQQQFFLKNGRQPSPLEMSRIILQEKIKSMVIIDELYSAYLDFTQKILGEFADSKKKSMNSAV